MPAANAQHATVPLHIQATEIGAVADEVPNLDRVIEAVYAAGVGEIRWEDALADLGAVIRAHCGALVKCDRKVGEVVAVASVHPKGRSCRACSKCSQASSDHLLEVLLSREDGLAHSLLFRRAAEDSGFRKQEMDLLERIAIHCRRAWRTTQRLGFTDRSNVLWRRLLDRATDGLVVCDPNRRVLASNEPAAKLLGRGARLIAVENRLCTRDSRIGTVFARMIRLACDPGAGSHIEPMVLRDAAGEPREGIEVSPLPSDLAAGLGTSNAAVVRIIPLSSPRPPSVPLLRATFGLTTAEAKLTQALVAGDSPAEYAEAAGLSVGTARWTVKQVQSKLGVRRQSEIVRMALAVAALNGGPLRSNSQGG